MKTASLDETLKFLAIFGLLTLAISIVYNYVLCLKVNADLFSLMSPQDYIRNAFSGLILTFIVFFMNYSSASLGNIMRRLRFGEEIGDISNSPINFARIVVCIIFLVFFLELYRLFFLSSYESLAAKINIYILFLIMFLYFTVKDDLRKKLSPDDIKKYFILIGIVIVLFIQATDNRLRILFRENNFDAILIVGSDKKVFNVNIFLSTSNGLVVRKSKEDFVVFYPWGLLEIRYLNESSDESLFCKYVYPFVFKSSC